MKTNTLLSLKTCLPLGVALAFFTAMPDTAAQTGGGDTSLGPPFLNFSSRVNVQTGDNVLIGGTIITGGEEAKRVMFRVVGPSLNVNGTPVPGRMEDPTLTLHGANGEFLQFRDDWVDASEPERSQIAESGLQPTDPREPALIHPSVPGGYTVVVRGRNNTTGIALVEIYDLDNQQVGRPDGSVVAPSRLGNISSRGVSGTGDNIIIGGAILGQPDLSPNRRMIIRGIGPSMVANGAPVPGRLMDPTLEVFDGNGTRIAMNDNWKSDQQLEIEQSNLAPTDDREAAIILTRTGGEVTAHLRGANGATGIGLIEFYELPNTEAPAAAAEN